MFLMNIVGYSSKLLIVADSADTFTPSLSQLNRSGELPVAKQTTVVFPPKFKPDENSNGVIFGEADLV